jgi:RND family efflux transporter MFP subunit
MTAPLANVLHHIRTLVGRSDRVGLSDGEILERFVSRQDESAFEELLARHGPMVLGVCQQLLRDPHDAEDAFQATFLVLVRRAGSIGKRDRLAGWLYGVAHRVAARSRSQTAQRRGRERRGVEMVAVEPFCQVAWDEVRPVIHEEVSRLPEKYRSPVVLCYLEGKTQEEAAKDLGWTRGTVKGRLERARDLLRKRLARRGLALSTGALAAVICPSATALPPALSAATTKAAMLLVAGQGLAAGIGSAQVISLTEGVLKTMVVTKLKLVAIVLAIVGVIGTGVAVSAYYSPAAEQETANKSDDTKRALQDDPPNKDRSEQDPKERKQEESTQPKVQVMRPISRQVVDHQDFTGRTEATKVDIFAQTSGELLKVLFQPGAEVKKGELLFETDPRAYQAELDKAEAEFLRAETRYKHASAQLERAKKQGDNKTVGQEEFERISAERDDTLAALQGAKASVTLAKLHLDSTKVTAPISGQTGRPQVTPGSVVKAGSTLLTTIVALEPMHAQFDIDERTFLSLVRQARKTKTKVLGPSVSLALSDEDGFAHRGTIDYVSNQVRAGTVLVRVLLPNKDGLLLPGLFVRVRLAVSEPHAALLVPQKALRESTTPDDNGNPRFFLFVVTDRKTVESRPVVLGEADNGLRIIKKGVSAEDWVIINGPQRVHEGISVEPERVSAPKQPKE